MAPFDVLYAPSRGTGIRAENIGQYRYNTVKQLLYPVVL